MRLRHLLALCVLSPVLLPCTGAAQSITVGYRQPADVFEILDNVSAWWPDYVESAYRAEWNRRGLAQPGDSTWFAQYRIFREKYFDRSGQSGGAPTREGSGLFTDRRAVEADPVGAAFHGAFTLDEAYASLARRVTPTELAWLRRFVAHFSPRVTPLTVETEERIAASLAATRATIALPTVQSYLGQVRGLFRIDSVPPFAALYVWWPDTAMVQASPSGRTLLLRLRPTAGDTINSADVVAHEAIHVYLAYADSSWKRTLSAAVLDRCTPPAGVRRLAVLEEAIATALGNIEFRRRFQPRRFSWSRRWYGDEWVNLSARLLHPVLSAALDGGTPLGASFGADAGATCASLAGYRSAPPR